jgi:hypothetical protein
MMACLLCILPQPGDPVRYLVLYSGTPGFHPRLRAPCRHPAMPLLKEELFQLLRELHLPDVHIIGAMTADHLIPEVPLTYAQISRYGIKRCLLSRRPRAIAPQIPNGVWSRARRPPEY